MSPRAALAASGVASAAARLLPTALAAAALLDGKMTSMRTLAGVTLRLAPLLDERPARLTSSPWRAFEATRLFFFEAALNPRLSSGSC